MPKADELSIKIDSTALLESLRRIGGGIDLALHKAVSELIEKGKEKVREKAPKPGQKPWTTGDLRNSIKSRLSELQGEIYTEKFYAWFVEKGTRSHWIGSPVLIGGVGWRYIGQHPGTTPQPMFDPTRRELEDDAPQIVRKHITKLIRENARKGL